MSSYGQYPELLISLARRDADSYSVESRFTAPGADAEVEQEPGSVTFDFDALEGAYYEDEHYGALLTQSLFADDNLRASFSSASNLAEYRTLPLRLRLFIDTDAPELQSLRWETLRDPRDSHDGRRLLAGERILFSRYLRSPEWRFIQPRPQAELRALVVVANPADLANWAPEGTPLQAIDAAAELDRARSGLGTIPVTALANPGEATVSKLCDHLRSGTYDILYLVCHGALSRDGRPRLFLENEQGNVAAVDGERLADELSPLWAPPTLVVLASCQSAGSGGKGALTAFGPRLARAAIPAVLAMQGMLTVETSDRFMRRFFVELGTDGQIDRAVAVARWEVRDRPDAWVPVLFTRLRGGCIWSAPSNVPSEQQFERWDAVITSIREGRCTPILGPGLLEFLRGSQRDLAKRWADSFRFPMSPYDRDNLPQVAQYLAISVAQGDPEFPRAKLEEYLIQEMRERFGQQLPEGLSNAPLEALFKEVGRQHREQDETEVHRVLAHLPLPIYMTTNPDNLLAEALLAEGKAPVVELCRWKGDDVDWPPSIYEREPDYEPTPERPLVYHLFGHMKWRDTIVLTEDDYFDYLVGVSSDQNIIPPKMRAAWTRSALLFLGFQVDDWNFRVLFRSILNQQGSKLRSRRTNVAVQIDPEEGRSLIPLRARKYLEESFQLENFTIYWGNTQQFVRELWTQWNRAGVRDSTHANIARD